MSWSVQFTGTPEGVSQELNEYEVTLNGQSLKEFSEAKPFLQGLLTQVVGQDNNVRLDANGHASVQSGEKVFSQVTVNLQPFYGKWCG